MSFMRFLLCLAFVICADPAQALRAQNPCKTGYVEWEDRPLSEIVRASDLIYMGTPVEFVKDDSQSGFDGYYLVAHANGIDLKGRVHGMKKVYGAAPYAYPPQDYFRVDELHSSFDENTTFWGRGGIGIRLRYEGSHCPLLPRFVIGYDYLMMFGTESRMSFEPIHSITTDNWYRLVENMVRSQEK